MLRGEFQSSINFFEVMDNMPIPLESAFEEWLHRRKLLSHSTVATHLTRLWRAIESYGIRRFLMTAVADKSIRQTQLYYKEFLCEYYMPLLLPLLQGEEYCAAGDLEGGAENV